MHRFFEAVFILQQPSYSSIFPLGQGMALALGWMIFGHPWAGVVLSMAALCAGCYWMLRGWTTPGWALAGGVLAACEFGPLNQWMNLYWGGAVSGIAGCLVFGALPRLRGSAHHAQRRAAGRGPGLQLLTRPFEFVLLAMLPRCFCFPAGAASSNALAVVALTLLPAVSLTLAQNKAVTGSCTTLPTSSAAISTACRRRSPFQPNPVPHRALTPEQQLDYQAQSIVHGEGTDTLASCIARLAERVHFYRFFFYPPLYLALPAFLLALGGAGGFALAGGDDAAVRHWRKISIRTSTRITSPR